MRPRIDGGRNHQHVEDAEASRVFALMKSLDAGPKLRKAPLDQVFRILIIDGLTQGDVARHYHCSPGLISLRVAAIEKRMRRSLDKLRQYTSRIAGTQQ